MASSEDDPGSASKGEDEAEIGSARPARLETLFDDLSGGPQTEQLCVGDILNALAHRSYGPLLLLPALISILPIIGAIPGVTWTMSALTLLISLQFLFNRQSLWLPRSVQRIAVPRGLFERSLEWSRPWLKRLDSFIHPRLNLMMGPPWPVLVAILCVLLSLAMFVASVVPGGVVIPAIGVIFLAIGLTTHDGLILLTGIIASGAAFWGVAELVF
ncbi:exopolysaccharide biosynthesis protein [Maricaulis sp.]|uniref:exopolysaccharide biosynthesis protein n=1 Tax=Maricaulis sp. TaxID=1486257 RepID=UPI002634CFC8|nr:exopolysaccharide biosynthesis protein [Maricaulis sp.]